MNLEGKFVRAVATVLLGLGLTCLSGRAQVATNDLVISQFDTSPSAAGWVGEWGSATAGASFDARHDALNLTNSGSLKLTANFDAMLDQGDNQFAFIGPVPLVANAAVDATLYTNLIFDVLWDPTNAPSNGGTNFGTLLVLLNSTLVGSYIVPTNAGWNHVVLPIDPTLPGIGQVYALSFQMWAPTFTGPVTFWLDNIELQAPTNAPPRPAPTLSMSPSMPGLQLVYATGAGANVRDSLYTVNPGYSWVGATTPTTYSVDIASLPNFAKHPYFQTHIFLIPAGSVGSAADENADWNSSNLIFLSIQSLTNGSGVALFMYKTDAAGGGWDNQIWGTNVLGGLWCSNVLGTWSLSFDHNTNVTLTAPNHETRSLVLPPAAVAWFTDTNGTYAYFGTQPSRDNNASLSASFAEIKITGGVDGFGNASPDIDDTFSADYLDPQWGESVPGGVAVASADTPYDVQWMLPDTGFALEANPDLTPGGWYDATYLTTLFQSGPVKHALIPYSVFGTNSSYFRLRN